MPRRRREAPAAGAARQPAVTQAELRQRARPQEAFHPVDQELASRSGLAPHPDVRAVASECHREQALPSERVRHRVILPEEARRDVQAAAYRGGQPAGRLACCPVQALRSAQGLPSEQKSLPAWVSRGGPQALSSEQAVSRLAQARVAQREPLPEVAGAVESGEPKAAALGACAAAALLRVAASGPGVRQAAEVSGRDAEAPRPEAATAA